MLKITERRLKEFLTFYDMEGTFFWKNPNSSLQIFRMVNPTTSCPRPIVVASMAVFDEEILSKFFFYEDEKILLYFS